VPVVFGRHFIVRLGEMPVRTIKRPAHVSKEALKVATEAAKAVKKKENESKKVKAK
jgi:hypothetical protein